MKVACILAAGMGSRLKSKTSDKTKCMVEVNGIPLINSLINNLEKLDYDKYLVVIGHEGERLRGHLKATYSEDKFIFVENELFSSTNNIFSLSLAADQLKNFDEVHLFESDVWINDITLNNYLSAPLISSSVLVSPYEYWMDGTCITLNSSNKVASFVQKVDLHRFTKKDLFKTVNIYKFKGDFFKRLFCPFMDAYINTTGKNSYYEDVFRVIMPLATNELEGYIISPKDWMEIDDAEDLRRAEILATPDKKIYHQNLLKQYGGYWKNSGVTDLTLLENPYFPTDDFMSEFVEQAQFAMKNYPSTQAVIASIAAKSVDFEPEEIIMGNGASELMKVLIDNLKGNVAVCEPMFLEYERLLGKRLAKIKRDFDRDDYFGTVKRNIEEHNHHLILINPNNPTGEALNRDEVVKLAQIQNKNNKLLIIDESFTDFSSQALGITRSMMTEHKNIVLIKSYGKIYGAGGVRLGAIFSLNQDLISELKAELPIWNVSSFGEIFLDLLPKYKKQYNESLYLLRSDRKIMENELFRLGFEFTISHANFILVKIKKENIDLTKELFLINGFLVKTLENIKSDSSYIRIPLKGRKIDDVTLSILSKLPKN